MEANPCSSHFSDDAKNELANEIAIRLKLDADSKLVVLGAMVEYKIEREEKSLVVYDGGETEYLIKRFLIAKKVKGCTDKTCSLYYRNLTLGFERIGKSPTQCSHSDIQAYLATLILRKLSKAYQQNVMRTFSSFYGWLQREEIIQRNIMDKIDPIKAQPPHKKAFTDMEIEKLRLAAARKSKRDVALIEVLLSTGMRVFELSTLRRDDCREDAIDIIGKGEKPRTVYMNAKAQLALAEYLKERKDLNPYVFPASIQAGTSVTVGKKKLVCTGKISEWYKKPENVSADSHMDNSSLESIIRSIGKLAGVENAHPHRFRRTCATLALRRGMPVTLVQQMLGHSSLATTQRYLDIQESELKDAHRKFVI